MERKNIGKTPRNEENIGNTMRLRSNRGSRVLHVCLSKLGIAAI